MAERRTLGRIGEGLNPVLAILAHERKRSIGLTPTGFGEAICLSKFYPLFPGISVIGGLSAEYLDCE